MGANSAVRKLAKALLYPLTNERTYKYVQAASKAMDIKRGTWSEPEIDLVKIGLRPGETALDIGANYGLYTYHMSKAVGIGGKVYSFEPVNFTFDSLRVVARILGFSRSTELVNKGCGNENCNITFTVPVQESGAFSAGLAYMGRRDDKRNGKEGQVRWSSTRDVESEIVRLDDFLPDIADLPFVKIDIEGAEFFCAQGAEKLFSKHVPATICEINPWYLEGFGITTDQLTSFFTDKGYKIFFYTNDSGEKKLRQVTVDEIVEDNYLFLHPSRFDRFTTLLPSTID